VKKPRQTAMDSSGLRGRRNCPYCHCPPAVVLTVCILCGLIPLQNVSDGAESRVLSGPEALEALRTIAQSNNAIRGSFATWRGTIDYEESAYYDNKTAKDRWGSLLKDDAQLLEKDSNTAVIKEVSGRVDFTMDFGTNRLLSHLVSKPPRFFFWHEKRKVSSNVNIPAFNQRTILTDDSYYHFQPNVKYGAPRMGEPKTGTGRAAFRSPPQQGEKQILGAVVSPRFFWGDAIPVGEFVQRLIDYSAKVDPKYKDLFRVIETDESGRVVYKTQYDTPPDANGEYARHEMTFDSAWDFAVTGQRATRSDGRVLQVRYWEYARRDGKIIPVVTTFKTMSPDGKNIQFARTLRVVESIINEPIPDKTFSIDNLGLVEGERLIDEIDNVTYVYRGNGNIEPLMGGLDASVEATQREPTTSVAGEGRKSSVTQAVVNKPLGQEGIRGQWENHYGRLAVVVAASLLAGALAIIYALRVRTTSKRQGPAQR